VLELLPGTVSQEKEIGKEEKGKESNYMYWKMTIFKYFQFSFQIENDRLKDTKEYTKKKLT
jgi:hypothetical protein